MQPVSFFLSLHLRLQILLFTPAVLDVHLSWFHSKLITCIFYHYYCSDTQTAFNSGTLKEIVIAEPVALVAYSSLKCSRICIAVQLYSILKNMLLFFSSAVYGHVIINRDLLHQHIVWLTKTPTWFRVSFGITQICFHRMPYDVEIEHDVKLLPFNFLYNYII